MMIRSDRDLNVEVVLRVTPQLNPDLGLPLTVATRRGRISCSLSGRHAIISGEEQLRQEIQGGLRAIDHAIGRWQAGEVDLGELEKPIYPVRISAGLFEELGGRVDWGEPDADGFYDPVIFRDDV